jgi:hypothetical protein
MSAHGAVTLGVVVLATGLVNAFWRSRVTQILKTRHPEVWRDLQMSNLSSRKAFARFLHSDRPVLIDDAELTRAIKLDRITGAVWIVCFLAAATVMVSLGQPSSR